MLGCVNAVWKRHKKLLIILMAVLLCANGIFFAAANQTRRVANKEEGSPLWAQFREMPNGSVIDGGVLMYYDIASLYGMYATAIDNGVLFSPDKLIGSLPFETESARGEFLARYSEGEWYLADMVRSPESASPASTAYVVCNGAEQKLEVIFLCQNNEAFQVHIDSYGTDSTVSAQVTELFEVVPDAGLSVGEAASGVDEGLAEDSGLGFRAAPGRPLEAESGSEPVSAYEGLSEGSGLELGVAPSGALDVESEPEPVSSGESPSIGEGVELGIAPSEVLNVESGLEPVSSGKGSAESSRFELGVAPSGVLEAENKPELVSSNEGLTEGVEPQLGVTPGGTLDVESGLEPVSSVEGLTESGEPKLEITPGVVLDVEKGLEPVSLVEGLAEIGEPQLGITPGEALEVKSGLELAYLEKTGPEEIDPENFWIIPSNSVHIAEIQINFKMSVSIQVNKAIGGEVYPTAQGTAKFLYAVEQLDQYGEPRSSWVKTLEFTAGGIEKDFIRGLEWGYAYRVVEINPMRYAISSFGVDDGFDLGIFNEPPALTGNSIVLDLTDGNINWANMTNAATMQIIPIASVSGKINDRYLSASDWAVQHFVAPVN